MNTMTHSLRPVAGAGAWLAITLMLTLGVFQAHAQTPYAIPWFTIDGGGGASTGGVYSVSGTLGQPDAGAASGGSYSLVGGFWGAVIPVQQAGAPTLFITAAGTNVTVSWLPNTPGFVLQQAGALTPPPIAWTNAPASFTNGVTIPASMPTRYFRLSQP